MYITAILTPEETARQADTCAADASSSSSASFADELSQAKSDNSLYSIFAKASQTYGVSMSLLTAMAKQESNFQADATSKSGAMGIMQLMPATAAAFGCANPYDPEENIMTGARYISQLLNKYNGNISLALAAYNAGSNNVDRYGGIPPFEETQNYVARITGYMEEGVTLPDGTGISGCSTGGIAASLFNELDSDTLREILDQLFSKDDYLKLIQLLLQELSDATEQTPAALADRAQATDDQTSSEHPAAKTLDVKVQSVPDSYYAYQNINYNNSVLNLMSQKSGESNTRRQVGGTSIL